VTVPAGQFDGCQRLILCHFGSSVSASCAGSLSRWLKYVFACATHRFLLDRVSGLRLPDAAVYPRFSLLRTSRKTGGYACTSVPEGQGLHLHGDEVTRLKVNLNLAVCPEAGASFRPTGRTADLVVKYQGIDNAELIFQLIWRRTIVQTSCRHMISRCEPLSPSQIHRFTTKSDGMWHSPIFAQGEAADVVFYTQDGHGPH
jgi:hypothetical protein